MKKLIIIPLLIISLLASATNYYVKTGGNDAAAGTADGTAWANHPWMSTWGGSVTLVAGDTVFMNRGDTWSISDPVAPFMTIGQNGSSGSYIVTTAYGTGNKPIIKVATATSQPVIYTSGKSFLVFDNLDVQHSTSVYNASDSRSGFSLADYSHDIIIQNCDISNVPKLGIHGNDNCYNIVVGDTTATSTATASNYSNHIYDFGYGGVGLEGTNAAGTLSNHKVYYNYIHGSTRTGSGENTYGIYFSTSPSSVANPVNIYARYNRIEDIITWEALDTHGATNVYFQDNYISNFGFDGILIAMASFNVYCERNIIVQESGWVAGSEGSFIQAGISSLGEDVYIRDNTLYYTTRPAAGDFYGINCANIDGLVISGNKIYNGSVTYGGPAIALGYNTATMVYNAEISGNYVSHWDSGIRLYGEKIDSLLQINNNIIVNGTSTGGAIYSSTAYPAAADVRIYNNTLMDEEAGSYVIRIAAGNAEGASFKFKNNIVGSILGTTNNYLIYAAGTWSGTVEFDYNLYYNSSKTDAFYYDGSARNWAYWQGTAGFDVNSPNVTQSIDPLFKGFNMYNRITDFDLRSTSPAINAGTDLGIDYDIFGHKRLGAHDIGAIESRAFRFYKY